LIYGFNDRIVGSNSTVSNNIIGSGNYFWRWEGRNDLSSSFISIPKLSTIIDHWLFFIFLLKIDVK
jgi:hypothetical protein